MLPGWWPSGLPGGWPAGEAAGPASPAGGASRAPEDQAAAAAESLQSCLTLCDPKDDSPPGSPVPETLQARTLEWVAISFSNA